MSNRRIYQGELHAHFVTFSCFRRRRILDADPCKRIVLGTLGQTLRANDGRCIGFVIMPNHAHAVLWFPRADCLSDHMNRWKSDSSHRVKLWLQRYRAEYVRRIAEHDNVWQARYYDFNIYSEGKLIEKLEYMHQNPVRAGLADEPVQWQWSSARWYMNRKPVGIPIWYPNG
ncbi:MAG: transposase [Pirellulales bacterium]